MAFGGIGSVITLGTWGGGYWFLLSAVNLRFWRELVDVLAFIVEIYMSHFAYVCKTEGISHLISALCINCLSSIPEYSRLNHLDVYLV